MRHALHRHPDTPCAAVSGMAVEVSRPEPGRLALRYVLSGVTDALVLPPALSGRADGLWRHTCFEAFVRPQSAQGYRELNMATGQWAAYRFDGYRAGMANADLGPPDIGIEREGAGQFSCAGVWDLDLPANAAWRVGAAVVIEEAGGRISYWALAHPLGKPDFHHADGLVLELPAPLAP